MLQGRERAKASGLPAINYIVHFLLPGSWHPTKKKKKKKTSINPIRRRRGGLRKLATDSSHTLSSLNYFLVGDRITRTHVFIRPRVFFSYSIEQEHFGWKLKSVVQVDRITWLGRGGGQLPSLRNSSDYFSRFKVKIIKLKTWKFRPPPPSFANKKRSGPLWSWHNDRWPPPPHPLMYARPNWTAIGRHLALVFVFHWVALVGGATAKCAQWKAPIIDLSLPRVLDVAFSTFSTSSAQYTVPCLTRFTPLGWIALELRH